MNRGKYQDPTEMNIYKIDFKAEPSEPCVKLEFPKQQKQEDLKPSEMFESSKAQKRVLVVLVILIIIVFIYLIILTSLMSIYYSVLTSQLKQADSSDSSERRRLQKQDCLIPIDTEEVQFQAEKKDKFVSKRIIPNLSLAEKKDNFISKMKILNKTLDNSEYVLYLQKIYNLIWSSIRGEEEKAEKNSEPCNIKDPILIESTRKPKKIRDGNFGAAKSQGEAEFGELGTRKPKKIRDGNVGAVKLDGEAELDEFGTRKPKKIRDGNFGAAKSRGESEFDELGVLKPVLISDGNVGALKLDGEAELVEFGSSCGKCPKHWNQIGTSCYHFSRETATWEIAVQDCNILNSVLLILRDPKEMEYVNRFAQDSMYWIGLKGEMKSCNPWRWLDGTLLTFSNWGPGEPKNAGNQNCVNTKKGAWYVNSCDVHLQYICKTFLNC